MNFHTVFMKLLCFISSHQRFGDINHTARFINTVWNENSFQILYIWILPIAGYDVCLLCPLYNPLSSRHDSVLQLPCYLDLFNLQDQDHLFHKPLIYSLSKSNYKHACTVNVEIFMFSVILHLLQKLHHDTGMKVSLSKLRKHNIASCTKL